MILPVSAILVIVDTLQKSLKIQDDGKLFMFTRETRDSVVREIIKQGSLEGIHLEAKDDQPSETNQTGNPPGPNGNPVSH